MAQILPHCCLVKDILLAPTPLPFSLRRDCSFFWFPHFIICCISRVSSLTLFVSTFLWLSAGFDLMPFSLTPSRNAAHKQSTCRQDVAPDDAFPRCHCCQRHVVSDVEARQRNEEPASTGAVTCSTWGL